MKKQLIKKTSDLLLKKINVIPQIAIITGSGISLFQDTKPVFSIKYNKLPMYSHIQKQVNHSIRGHKGEINIYEVKGKHVLVFSGRKHLYQGLSFSEVTSNVRLCFELGTKKLIITNAAGGINNKFIPSDLMLISGFIDLMQSTERGILSGIIHNPKKINTPLTKLLKKHKLKSGIYAGMQGPTYETYSEIKLLKSLGADAVGMSTVPELIVAKSLGLDYTGISIISNVWDKKHKPSHEEVLKNVSRANKKLNTLITDII